MSKYDINEAFIQALQEQEQEDAKNTVLKLSDKMKEIPVKKGSITATPSIERTMRTAKDRRDKKQEKASITVTQDVNSEEEALELVNDSSYFKVGDEVEVNDWNGRTYKVKKTQDYKYKDGKRIEEPEKKDEILDISVNANDIGSNNDTNLDLGGLGDLGSLLGEEKKEELFNVNIDAGDIGSNNSTNLDLGDIGALAGLLASEEPKESEEKLEEGTDELNDTEKSAVEMAIYNFNNGDKEDLDAIIDNAIEHWSKAEDGEELLPIDKDKVVSAVKSELKLQEDGVEISGGEEGTETITGLHTDLFKLVNMYQYQIADGIMCDRDELDETMRKYAEPIIEDAFHTALPSSRVTFKEFDHPPYYKLFTNLNDQLLFDVTFNKAEYEALKEKTINDPAFADYIAQNYCSYDGFISYMADNMEDFNNEEEWRQFVQVVQYNMPEFTESDYDRFVSDVVEDLYENFDTEESFIEYALENIPEGADVETWVKENANVSENYDLDWVIDAIKDELKTNEPKEESKKIKTEDTDEEVENDDEEDEDDDPYGETVSLFARAYREIPEVGVEEWGKDNEIYFYLDVKDFLAELEYYEEEIPKKMVDEASYDDWSNGIDEYLETFKGINPDKCESDNTYNWGSRISHDLNLNFYEGEDGFYVAIDVHKSGDVRGNYTTRFLLRFDNKDEWYEACFEAQANCKNTVELDGKHYTIEPDFWSEYCNIWCEEDQDGWDEVYCEDLDGLRDIIANQETNNY